MIYQQLTYFIWLIAIRAASGGKNAAFYHSATYHKPMNLAYMFATLQAVMIIAFARLIDNPRCIFFVIPVIFLAIMSRVVFTKGNAKRIHLYEHLVMDSLYLVAIVVGVDIIGIVLGIIPGLVLFNMPIRYGKDHQLIVADEGMKREEIDAGWFKFKIPRFNNGFKRLYWGIGCVALYLLNYFTVNWQVTINDIIQLFKQT